MINKNLRKTLITLILAVIFHLNGAGQWIFSDWAATLSTKGWDIVNDMLSDSSGNIYITGSSSDTTVNTRTSIPNNHTRRLMYIAKFDSAGNLLWKKYITNSSWGFGNLLAMSGEKIILAGGFEDAESEKDLNKQIKKSGLFISSLNKDGIENWKKSFIGTRLDYLTSIALDTVNEEILIAGYFHDTLKIQEKTFVSKGNSDGIILQLNMQGALNKAQVLGEGGYNRITCLTVDKLGNHYALGTFHKRINLNQNNTLSLNSNKDCGLFLVKYNHEGKLITAKNLATGTKIKPVSCLIFDDNFLISGNFSDNLSTENQILRSQGGEDIFLLCLDVNMKEKWSKKIGGNKKDHISRAMNIKDEIIFTGSFCSSVIFDKQTLTSKGNGSDIFIFSLNLEGDINWVMTTGGKGDDFLTCLDYTPNKGYIYIAGSFKSAFNLNGKNIQSAGNEDIVIARLENCKPLLPKFNHPESICEGNFLRLDPGGGYTSYNWNNGESSERIFETNEPGAIFLELIAKNGCRISDTISVVQSKKPQVNLGNDTIISDTSRIVLHPDDQFKQYLWNNGSTAPEIVIKGVTLTEGPNQIKLSIIDDQGCTGDDEIVIMIKRAHSTKLPELVSGKCIIYPNPAHDLIKVSFTMPLESLKLTLTNTLGTELITKSYSGCVENKPIDFNTNTISPGLYLLQLETELGTATKKIIIQ